MFSIPLPSIFKFSATTSARLIAFVTFGFFCLALSFFSFDHYDKVAYQMQNTLIEENIIYVKNYGDLELGFGERAQEQVAGDFFVFEDDGQSDNELYNDENFY